MRNVIARCLLAFLIAATTLVAAQSDYKVVSVSDGGTISGSVKWSGTVPRALDFLVRATNDATLRLLCFGVKPRDLIERDPCPTLW